MALRSFVFRSQRNVKLAMILPLGSSMRTVHEGAVKCMLAFALCFISLYAAGMVPQRREPGPLAPQKNTER